MKKMQKAAPSQCACVDCSGTFVCKCTWSKHRGLQTRELSTKAIIKGNISVTFAIFWGGAFCVNLMGIWNLNSFKEEKTPGASVEKTPGASVL